MKEFNEYPPGIQNLLEWGKYHLEELARLELDFRAWQAAQKVRPNSDTEFVTLLNAPSRAMQARLNWEARVRTGGIIGVGTKSH